MFGRYLDNNPTLEKVLGKTEVFALSFGSMVGWSWMILTGGFGTMAGSLGTVIALGASALVYVCVGSIYAELISALPLAGGELYFSYRSMGYTGSWITGWALCLAYLGVVAWETIGLSMAFNHLMPLRQSVYLWTIAGSDVYLSWALPGVIGAILLTVINLFGIKLAAALQLIVVFFMVLLGILFFTGGIAFGDPGNAAPLVTDLSGIGMVFLMTPAMFVGFDIVAKSAEEIHLPMKQMPKVMKLSILAVGVWYCLSSLTCAVAAPAGDLTGGQVPVASAAAALFGAPVFSDVMILCGIAGIITSWNGFIVGVSRILFAMGRARMLPRIFATAHPKSRAPVFALAFMGLASCSAPFFGAAALGWLVNTSAFCTLVVYLLVSISYLIMRRREPNLPRAYRLKHGTFFGVAVACVSVALLALHLPLSPVRQMGMPEIVLIVLWGLIGLILSVVGRYWAGKANFSELDRERRMFGAYSRQT